MQQTKELNWLQPAITWFSDFLYQKIVGAKMPVGQ